MRKLGLFIYLGCLLFTVAKTLIRLVRAGKAVPSISGRNGWYYLIFRDDYGRYYFVTDFSGQGERGSKPLYELVKEIRYRIFFYKSGRVLDNSDVMVSLYYSWFAGAKPYKGDPVCCEYRKTKDVVSSVPNKICREARSKLDFYELGFPDKNSVEQ